MTGPSFTSSTSIIAPKRPVSTRRTLAARAPATTRSTSAAARAGSSAPTKDGRRPLRQSPKSVNCDTTSDLVDERVGRRVVVVLPCTDQREEAPVDRPHELAVDVHGGARHALHDCAHQPGITRSRCERTSFLPMVSPILTRSPARSGASSMRPGGKSNTTVEPKWKAPTSAPAAIDVGVS